MQIANEELYTADNNMALNADEITTEVRSAESQITNCFKERMYQQCWVMASIMRQWGVSMLMSSDVLSFDKPGSCWLCLFGADLRGLGLALLLLRLRLSHSYSIAN